MSTIFIQHGSLQATAILKRDKIEPTNLICNDGRHQMDYSHDVFNALLALGNSTSNVRFVVDALSHEEDIIAVLLAADFVIEPSTELYVNPAWRPSHGYELQIKTDGVMYYPETSDEQIQALLLEGKSSLRRILAPTEDQIAKYALLETPVPGVYNF